MMSSTIGVTSSSSGVSSSDWTAAATQTPIADSSGRLRRRTSGAAIAAQPSTLAGHGPSWRDDASTSMVRARNTAAASAASP